MKLPYGNISLLEYFVGCCLSDTSALLQDDNETLCTPEQVAARAVDIAEAAIAELEKRGWVNDKTLKRPSKVIAEDPVMDDKRYKKTFKVGDKIRCIDNTSVPLVPGQIYEVIRVNDDGYVWLKYCMDEGYRPTRFELVVAEGQGLPGEDTHDDFKPGDRVRCTDASGSNGKLGLGQWYTVEGADGNHVWFKGWPSAIWYKSRFQRSDG
jgi:hypothetical protein